MAELTKTVHVKMSDEQFERLSEAAWSRRVSNSEWIRQCVFGLGDKVEGVDLKVGNVVLSGHPPVPEKALKTPDSLDVIGESLGKSAILKDGYGWCKACGVEQVKLPNLLCRKCL